MGLRFIFGRSGVGKTEYLRDYVIKSSMDNPDVNYIVMVPEQSNLKTQTDYVLHHPNKGILNIDILSFKRLAYRIFSETGGFHNRVLDESGKLMILKRVADECSDRLTMLRKPMERMDSLNKLKSIISEFSQYHVCEDTFKDVIEHDTIPGLSSKLKDLVTLYDYYLEYIAKDYITDEQVMDVLAEKIKISELVRNTVFVFDEYTGFTFLQNEVLRQLLRFSKEVIISLTMDISYINETVVPEYDLFSLSVKTKTELTCMALQEKVKIHEPICIKENSNRKKDEFFFLEKNLFDYSADSFNEKTDKVIICESVSPEQEVAYLRKRIASLVREEGYAYSDIAVVTGDLKKYGIYFEKMMNDAHIPCFVDDSKELQYNAFLEFIKALLDIINEDFSYKSVFRFLKSGLYGFSKEEIDLLENYCIAGGICSLYAWERPWDKLISGIDDEALASLNDLRLKFVADLKEFVFVMTNAGTSVKDRVYSLYSFLADIKTEGKLLALSESFDKSGDYLHFVEYRQVYGAVIHILDELVEIMGDKTVTCEEFSEILDAGFSAVKIGLLPPGNDYVVLADVERSRISKTKVLFLLGANEGIIPANNEKIGFLNESERLFLKDAKISLSPTSHEEFYTQKYYLYRILTKATDKLFISYSNFSEGEEINPSYLVKNIEELFPFCIHVSMAKEMENNQIFGTKSDAYEFLLNSFDYNEETWNRVYEYLSNDSEYEHRLRKIQEGLIYKGDNFSLGEKLAEKLFVNDDKNLTTSVSRLETYATCPYAHFLKYGIEIKERVTPEMAAVDYGTVFHTALEDYIRILKQMEIDVKDVSNDTAEIMAAECITNAFNKVYRSYNQPSSRDRYHITRMIRLMRRTVWAMKKQFSDGLFSIKNVEYKFDGTDGSYAIELDNERKVYLRGKIDRIDTYTDGDREIIRVVDYKTGSSGFSMMKFYYGIQLQLVVYLDIISEIEKKNNKNVIPAGAFYYNINDPVIDTDKVKNKDIDSAILKELRLHGYQNSDVLCAADKSTNEEGLKLMMNHGRRKIKEISEELISGNVAKKPYMLKDNGIKTGCDYCDYRQVCLFDETMTWCRPKRLKNLSDEEIFGILKESEGALDEMDS